MREANRMYMAGEPGQAVALLKPLVRESEAFGATDERRMAACLNLGVVYRETGRPRDAVRMLELALKAVEADGGGATRIVLAALNQLTVNLLELEQYGKAEEAIRRTRRRLQDSGEAWRAERANTDVLESRLLLYRGRSREAAELARAALERERALGGPVTAEQSFLWNALGTTLMVERSWREAGEATASAIDLSRRLYGEGHPATAKAMVNLANVHRNMGQPGSAERLAGAAAESRQGSQGFGPARRTDP